MNIILFRSFIIAVLVFGLILVTGCSKITWDNVDKSPPTRGFLAMIQQSRMTNITDRGYSVTAVAVDGESIRKGDIDIRLLVEDRSGIPVRKFTEDRTQLMHLIVVSKDLATFQHVHPQYEGDGLFTIRIPFPKGGPYMLISEFIPDRQEITTHRQWITVAGEAPPSEEIIPDKLFSKKVGDLHISLSASSGLDQIRAGEMVMLQFRVSDAQTLQPVAKLEAYLGASGHSVILNSEADVYVHVHAAEEMSSGGDVMFHTVFPETGIYKIWGQFQYNGEVITVPFVIQVV
ncbi:hypothetical protein [Paenibacillus eucommiae]|uniref:Nucleotidyltransferase n=1 Tax=Paenibacillus eucommiae TaxID=1355755 RepID=A0ABS4IV75_9BACL|nr:hypothetical protein [Paenibacillus eucommiae]MBP1991491.1 putative nucleotidyltransferase [Paenibacillus eucommiae]